MKIVHQTSSSILLIISLHLIVWQIHTPPVCCARIPEESDSNSTNVLDDGRSELGGLDNGPFLNISELKHVDLKQLLEVNIINNSVNHFQNKFQRVHTSLQDQINQLISGVRGVRSQFSPELKQKLNESFFKLVEDLEISPYCLASLNHIKIELSNKRLWPLKCKFKQ